MSKGDPFDALGNSHRRAIVEPGAGGAPVRERRAAYEDSAAPVPAKGRVFHRPNP